MSWAWAFLTVACLMISLALVRHTVSARRTVLTQLRLDRCVGKRALEIRDLANQVEVANRTLEALRIALAGMGWWPPTGASLRASIQVVYGFQEFRIATWWIHQTKWMVHHCGNWTFAAPFRGTPWTRPPPDALGPQPVRRNTQHVEFKAWTRHLRGAARIEWLEKDSRWFARWIPFT